MAEPNSHSMIGPQVDEVISSTTADPTDQGVPLHEARRRLPWAAAAVVVYLILILGVFVAPLSGPTIFEDEHGPIETARTCRPAIVG